MSVRRVFAVTISAMGAAAIACRSAPVLVENANRPAKILLVTIDTLRADHVSAYGYQRETTPHLDALAERGVRFANAYSVMPTTDPAHASMMTCQYPRTHGIMKNGAKRANADGPSLAAWLGKRGYVTAAITARLGLDPQVRRIEGFSHSDAPRLAERQRSAADVLARALGWLEARQGEHWFLWVHLWEPHKPYQPEQPARRMFARGVPRKTRYEDPVRFLPRGRRVSPQVIRAATSLYDGEIWLADRALGELVEAATEAAPAGTEPLIVVLSDHGESLAERQTETRVGFGHGTHINDEVVKVPWVVHWGARLRPAVIKTPVSIVDLTPTLIDMVEPGGRMACEGRTLAQSVHTGTEPTPIPLVVDRRLFNSRGLRALAHDELAWVEYPWKLLRNEGAKRALLYRLDVDPGETRDLASAEPAVAARLFAALSAWKAVHPLAIEDAPLGEDNAAELEGLRALGYIH